MGDEKAATGNLRLKACFLTVVMKVLMFMVSVIGVELYKITLHLLFVASDHLVDVSCLCRSSSFEVCFVKFFL